MPAQEKIRVLIVDDISETRENIQRLLQFDRNIDIIGNASSGRQAIALSQELKPDVIIMDINMPDMDGITATEEIRRKIPYVQIVILSVQGDPSYMRRAMMAGARDFLTKPPSIDELTNAINRAGAMAVEEKAKVKTSLTGISAGGIASNTSTPNELGMIVVVYSPKGGTGSTTISTNLALNLAQKEENKVVLVDGSIQFGDVAVFLNEQIQNNIVDLTSRADELEREVVEDVAFHHSSSNLHIIAAPPKPEYADQVIGESFGKTLKYLRRIYSHIIVDTSSYLTDAVQNAIDNADLIILITTQTIPAIKNANHFLSLTDASEIKRERIVFVMNKYDKRSSISPERVSESLRQNIAVSIPLEERLIDYSINRGIPIILENRTHPVSRAIIMLTDKIQEKINELAESRLDSLGI